MKSSLNDAELTDHIECCPEESRELILELRAPVLAAAPEAAETIAFNSLCYYKPDSPFGTIGGNVCMIGTRRGRVQLGFIHGARLTDPVGILQGDAKARRHVYIDGLDDINRPALTKLIRAAVAFTPTD